MRHRRNCPLHAAGINDPARDRLTPGDRGADGVAEALIGSSGDGGFQSPADGAVWSSRGFEQQIERQTLQKLRLLGLVEHIEARRDIGLERKLVKKLGAECVDRLHFQPAGRLQRSRE